MFLFTGKLVELSKVLAWLAMVDAGGAGGWGMEESYPPHARLSREPVSYGKSCFLLTARRGFMELGGKEQRLFCRAETLALSELVKRLRDSQRRGEKREAKRRVEMRGGDKENIAS